MPDIRTDNDHAFQPHAYENRFPKQKDIRSFILVAECQTLSPRESIIQKNPADSLLHAKETLPDLTF
ncbi:hypothetical protein DWW90_18525 [Parabacteroides sp. AF17-28]|nr:hypothetical protein DWW90_18525 [Parabacteroides sp. AF17-28]